VIEYTIRSAGLTNDQNFANSKSLLNAFGKWKPEDRLTIHRSFRTWAVTPIVPVEAGDPKVIASFVSKYNFWNDVNVVPVVDVGDVVPVVQTSLGWARSTSKS
jgi:hypothetical protein